MKNFFFKEHALNEDGRVAGDDRGDELVVDAVPNDEEKKLAEEVKAKGEAEAAAKLKDESKDDDDEKKKDTRIPLSRHKEILETERNERARVEAKLAQYEHGADITKVNEEITAAETEIVKMEGEYAQLAADGKTQEAAKKMSEIRKLDRTISDNKVTLQTTAAEARAYERARYDTTVERIEEAYPELREDNPDKDPKMIAKVLRIAKAYGVDGMPPGPALQMAVKDLLGEPKTKKQENAVDVLPKVSEADAKKAAREEAARLKAAKTVEKSPPDLKNAGLDSDKMGGSLSAENVMKLSYTEFSKLDDAALSLLRGDEAE